jgi:hypothetical protein
LGVVPKLVVGGGKSSRGGVALTTVFLGPGLGGRRGACVGGGLGGTKGSEGSLPLGESSGVI